MCQLSHKHVLADIKSVRSVKNEMDMKRKSKKLPTTPVVSLVERLSHDGRGIARIDGKTTFIEGALPGEKVSFIYTRLKSDFDEGRLQEVLQASPDRVEPHCPHYALCGGCSYQHVSPHRQIEQKEEALLDVLKRIGHCQPQQVAPPIVDQTWHYRSKARLSVRYVEKKQSVLVGFRERHQPRYITDIQTCAVLDERVSKQLLLIRAVLDQLQDKREIAQIEVATGDDEVALVIRHLSPLSHEDLSLLSDLSRQTRFKIFLQPDGPDSIHLVYPPDASAWLEYRLPDFDVTYRFQPSDFTQINPSLNRLMVSQAVRWLEPQQDDVVLDLFCGLGNFSLPIARRVARVIGIEGSQSMVERATMNARNNQLTNTEFMCSNLEGESALSGLMQRGINKVLIDPPRTGAIAVVHQLRQMNPERVVYVSCNPVTLARDADVMVNQLGYKLVFAGVMDMFPHTAHVESMALFVRD